VGIIIFGLHTRNVF